MSSDPGMQHHLGNGRSRSLSAAAVQPAGAEMTVNHTVNMPLISAAPDARADAYKACTRNR